jgi:DNA-directed RNA polymerase specialized sigma24 family protein
VVRGFSRLEQLRHDERVLPWLFGIARHVALESLPADRRAALVMRVGDTAAEREACQLYSPPPTICV